jgi:hypothetical protein
VLRTGNQAGCLETPVLLARRPRILTVVLEGDMRRLSGQGPGTRLSRGLLAQVVPVWQAARAHRSSQPATSAAEQPSRKPRADLATERQRPAPAGILQPRAKLSGQRDRPSEKAFSTGSRRPGGPLARPRPHRRSRDEETRNAGEECVREYERDHQEQKLSRK